MSRHYVIVGNGAAGVSAAEVIRQRDHAGRITIFSDEPYRMYSRPGIAYFLLNQISESQIMARRDSFYRDNGLDLQFKRVAGIDPAGQILRLENGQTVPYDTLLLATGAKATPPSFPGKELEGLLTLDTLDNAKKIIQASRKAKASVVIGGGITAMELAEGLHHQGLHTHLLQRGDRMWPRLFDARESAIIEHQIQQEGIHLHFNEEISEAYGKNGQVTGVKLQSGKEIKCQLVGVAIGVKPNMQLMKGLPIEQNQGVLVNDFMQSSLPTIFAAGDVAQAVDRWTKKPQLDILWPTAIDTGRVAGYNMVEVAHGRSGRALYHKNSPFNAALLFGVHITVIGRVGVDPGRSNTEEVAHLSRGSSQIWTSPFITNYRSAWDKNGSNSIRVVMEENRIVGALLMGNQNLADPLRQLIENQVPITDSESLVKSDTHLPKALLTFWRSWHQSWQ